MTLVWIHAASFCLSQINNHVLYLLGFSFRCALSMDMEVNLFYLVFITIAVAKPLVADGSAKSHELSLAYDQHSLLKLEPPLVLQEFVNHGMRF